MWHENPGPDGKWTRGMSTAVYKKHAAHGTVFKTVAAINDVQDMRESKS